MQHPTCQCSGHQRRSAHLDNGQTHAVDRNPSLGDEELGPCLQGGAHPSPARIGRTDRALSTWKAGLGHPVLQLQCRYPAVPQPLAGGRGRSDLPSADRCRLRFGVCVKPAESSLVAAGTTNHISVALSRTKAPRRVGSSLTARLMTRQRGGSRLAFLVRKAFEHTTPLLEARRSVRGRDDLVDHSNAIDVTRPSAAERAGRPRQ